MSWQDRAACLGQDPEDFFPEKGQNQRANKAMLTCFTCPVRQECDEWREEVDATHGVWAAKYLTRDSD